MTDKTTSPGAALLDSAAAAAYLNVGRNTFFRLKKEPGFPAPIKFYQGQSRLLWSIAQLDNFIRAKMQEASCS